MHGLPPPGCALLRLFNPAPKGVIALTAHASSHSWGICSNDMRSVCIASCAVSPPRPGKSVASFLECMVNECDSQGAAVPGSGPGGRRAFSSREGQQGSRCPSRPPCRSPAGEPRAVQRQQRGSVLLPQSLAGSAGECTGRSVSSQRGGTPGQARQPRLPVLNFNVIF